MFISTVDKTLSKTAKLTYGEVNPRPSVSAVDFAGDSVLQVSQKLAGSVLRYFFQVIEKSRQSRRKVIQYAWENSFG